jgi:hypothetical protein
MKTFNHVSNTWLVAVFFFPFLFLGYDLLTSGNATPELLLPLFLFGTIFSLPSYFLCLLLFRTVMQSPFTLQARLLLWMVVILLCICADMLLIALLFFHLTLPAEMLGMAAAAGLAALLSVMIRMPQFLNCAVPFSKPHNTSAG